MKTFNLSLGLFLITIQIAAQKTQAPLASNLNLSKSNINRLIYPGSLLTSTNAQALLADLDKINPPDEAGLKTWLVANFKRFGVDPDKVKQISIYATRQFTDCTICKKNCKGKCVQDPGTDCVCIHKSDPNLRMSEGGKPGAVIYLSGTTVEETAALEAISTAMAAQKPVKKVE